MARILVIDDSKIARLAMRKLLERSGHEIDDVDRATAGLERLAEEAFDVVTCDVLMPDLTGIEFLEKARERGIDTPIIIVTADIQKTTQDECRERGAWAVLSKPVDADQLYGHVESAVEANRPGVVQISGEQRDALTELVNIGVGRAASALNDLVEGHVELRVPQIDLIEIDRLHDSLTGLERDAVSSVQMGFNGSLDGFAFLVFPQPSAAKLVEIVMADEPLEGTELDSIHSATLTEIGNIVISAVMGTIANVLDKSLGYSLPIYEQEPIMDLLALRQGESPVILIAKTSFTIRRSSTIEGRLLLLFELSSLDTLLASIGVG